MSPSVTIAQGELRGSEQDGVRTFLGIPYAQPPFGPLRFRAPVPAHGWDGVRDATEYGATVPKPGYRPPMDAILPDRTIAGRDCLNLNVWTTAGDEPQPVMVWIHGGAFVNGSGALSLYDGSRFARDGVVCVSINYRLGVDGFAPIEGAVANRGLLDQIAALHWVQDNISAFGGDPEQVTVAGESAGAMSVGALLALPATRGLFQRAILQSGAAQHVLTPDTAAGVTAEIAARLQVPATVAGLGSVPVDVLTAMQEQVTIDIATHPDPSRWSEITVNAMPFEPVVDGDVLAGPPLSAIAAGATAGIDVLIGTNRDEHRLFMVPNGFVDLVDETRLHLIPRQFGVDVEATIEQYRSTRPDATPGELLIAIYSDWFFRIPAIRIAEARLGHGADTFGYEFTWPSPQFDGRLGACHALEIGFVFDNLDDPAGRPLTGPTPPQALAEEMHSAWVRFIRLGDPGWPAYGSQRLVRRFGPDGGLVTDPAGAERELWAGVR